MLKDLVKVANRLDSLGLTREADTLDLFIQKEASDFAHRRGIGSHNLDRNLTDSEIEDFKKTYPKEYEYLITVPDEAIKELLEGYIIAEYLSQSSGERNLDLETLLSKEIEYEEYLKENRDSSGVNLASTSSEDLLNSNKELEETQDKYSESPEEKLLKDLKTKDELSRMSPERYQELLNALEEFPEVIELFEKNFGKGGMHEVIR